MEGSSSSGCGIKTKIVEIARARGDEGSKSTLVFWCWSLGLKDGRSNTGLETGGGKTGKYGWMKT